MKLAKKLAALGLIGIMAVGQSVSALAAYEYKLNVGFGHPYVLGDEIYHSMTVTLDYPVDTYLGAEMKVYYTKYNIESPSYYVSTSKMDKTTKRKSIGANKSWTDKGSETARVYGNYYAYGYHSYGGNTGWDLVASDSDPVDKLLNP